MKPKSFLLIFLICFLLTSSLGAQTLRKKIIDMTAETAPASTDIIYIVKTPSTPLDRKATLGNTITKGHGLSDGDIKVSSGVMASLPPGTSQAEYNNGVCTTAKTISAVNGNRQRLYLSAAQTCALTFTQPASGTMSILLKIIQAATPTGAISGGLWPGGAVPTITGLAGAVDFVSCYLDGTTAYCGAIQDFR
jgi:hypothetical protein